MFISVRVCNNWYIGVQGVGCKKATYATNKVAWSEEKLSLNFQKKILKTRLALPQKWAFYSPLTARALLQRFAMTTKTREIIIHYMRFLGQ